MGLLKVTEIGVNTETPKSLFIGIVRTTRGGAGITATISRISSHSLIFPELLI